MNKTKQKKVDSEEVLVMGLGGMVGVRVPELPPVGSPGGQGQGRGRGQLGVRPPVLNCLFALC